MDVQKLIQKDGDNKGEQHSFDWMYENSTDKSKGNDTLLKMV
jgi:hypothetical protein